MMILMLLPYGMRPTRWYHETDFASVETDFASDETGLASIEEEANTSEPPDVSGTMRVTRPNDGDMMRVVCLKITFFITLETRVE
jgi:hypothetical protein